MVVLFRITYSRWSELRDDVVRQMARGGLLVRVDTAAFDFDTPVTLELVLPDGTVVEGDAKVLQRLEGHGIAVTIGAGVVEELRRRAADGGDGDGESGEPARHEWVDPSAAPAVVERPRSTTQRTVLALDSLTQAQKIHMAMHGTRDERNAILRDQNRALHPFVLKNPQLNADDVLEICKNAQTSPAVLKLIAERKDWVQRGQVAVALVKNPKTPQNVALQALAYVPIDALRIMAKGNGVMPHVAQAARKKVIGK